MKQRIVTISGGLGKSTALSAIHAYLTQQGKKVLSVTSSSTYLGVRQALQATEHHAVLIDNDGNDAKAGTDLAKRLAHKFPEVFFYVTA